MSAEDDGPKWVEMPSIADQGMSIIDPGEPYHDLGMRFPDAPVPRSDRDVITVSYTHLTLPTKA